MEYLITNNHLLENDVTFNVQITQSKNWQYELIKPLVNDVNSVIRIIMSNDDTFIGIVSKLDESHVVLNGFDTEGTNEFFTLYKLEDIKSIRINDLDARKRLLLFKWKNRL